MLFTTALLKTKQIVYDIKYSHRRPGQAVVQTIFGRKMHATISQVMTQYPHLHDRSVLAGKQVDSMNYPCYKAKHRGC